MNEMGRDTLEIALPEQRECTRCEGTQHLVASHAGLGKYRCDTCELVVGFDLDSHPVEFLIHRGLPGSYTKQSWGPQLGPGEQRLSSAGRG
ncbi:MAG: hypothetical protein M3N32_10450 [Actinomycetota bacterium]|nr:hypothetical protein [Actinomycetota bacterium]